MPLVRVESSGVDEDVHEDADDETEGGVTDPRPEALDRAGSGSWDWEALDRDLRPRFIRLGMGRYRLT
ncbi:MAG: hypothetical protein ABIT01_16390, partial [Thermoanaerobaculia bacterium]